MLTTRQAKVCEVVTLTASYISGLIEGCQIASICIPVTITIYQKIMVIFYAYACALDN